ncbi:dUTPase [Exiguobacterium phage vB_EauM-23]|nr:dUTPase [Exiguobacterium phage vB_EauM-23]
MITKEMFKDMILMQRQLDAIIMKNQRIERLNPTRVHASYIVELAETVNEMKGDFKYWSIKEPDTQKFLEELVDATHFMLTYSYVMADKQHGSYEYEEGEDRIDYRYRLLKKQMEDMKEFMDVFTHKDNFEIANEALLTKDLLASYAYLLIIAERYNINGFDLMRAYEDKYLINIERSESGTY